MNAAVTRRAILLASNIHFLFAGCWESLNLLLLFLIASHHSVPQSSAQDFHLSPQKMQRRWDGSCFMPGSCCKWMAPGCFGVGYTLILVHSTKLTIKLEAVQQEPFSLDRHAHFLTIQKPYFIQFSSLIITASRRNVWHVRAQIRPGLLFNTQNKTHRFMISFNYWSVQLYCSCFLNSPWALY